MKTATFPALLFVFISLFISLLSSVSVCAQEPVQVTSTIKKVTVFAQGTQVSREAKVTVRPGNNELIFSGMPYNLDEQSIQVSTPASFTILSVKTEPMKRGDSDANDLQIKRLNARLHELNDSLAYAQSLLQIYEGQIRLLGQLDNKFAPEQEFTLNDMKEAIDYQKIKLSEIRMSQLHTTNLINGLNVRIGKVQADMQKISVANSLADRKIIIAVSSEKQETADLTLSYYLDGAAWTSSYDIRVDDITRPVTLIHKAGVRQNTGEDWRQVKISLSSGNPRQSGARPQLGTWLLSYDLPYVSELSDVVVIGYGVSREAPASYSGEPGYSEDKKRRDETVPVTTIENVTTTTYDVELPYTIPSDFQDYTVRIRELSLPAVYQYYCVPKLDKDAFLIAKIDDWESSKLSPGITSLYFEGTYLGKSDLNLQNAGDTLQLSLGRDKDILVSRDAVKQNTTKQIFGSNRIETRSFEITVKNLKKQTIAITIEDQIPVSTTDEIIVELLETSNAKVDKNRGILSWELKIEPGKEQKLMFKYQVKYPKQHTIMLE